MTEERIRIIRSMSLSELDQLMLISRTIPSEIRFEVTKRINDLRYADERMQPLYPDQLPPVNRRLTA